MVVAPRADRTESGRAAPYVVVTVLLVLALTALGLWVLGPGLTRDAGPERTRQATERTPDTCERTTDRPGPLVDLQVQASRGAGRPRFLSERQVGELVGLARQAGATVISTSASFRTMQPRRDGPIDYRSLDRVVAAARAAGLDVKVQMTGMPRWALDDDDAARLQPPTTKAELRRWTEFVGEVMRHVDGAVRYVEVWTEPNAEKYWPTGPDPVGFARLLDVTYREIRSVSPDTQVVSGGLRGNDIGYLEAVYDAVETLGLGRVPFDLVGVEPFNGGEPPDRIDPDLRYAREPFGSYDENFTGFTGLHQAMAMRDDGDRPLYITLFGYSDDVAGPSTAAVPDATRAKYLTTAMEQATCFPYVAVFSWYTLHPSPWDPPSWTLLDERSRPNLTYDALREWTSSGPGAGAEPTDGPTDEQTDETPAEPAD